MRVVTRWESPARIVAPEPAAWLPILVALDAETRLGQLRGPLVDLPAVHLAPPPPDALATLEPEIQIPETQISTSPALAASAGYPEPTAPRAGTAVRTQYHWWHTLVLVVALAAVVAGLPYFLRASPQRHVTLVVDGIGTTHATRGESVAALLATAGIELRRGDLVEPPLGSELDGTTTVTVTRAFPVTVMVDGVSRHVRTPAGSVGELRDDLDLAADLVAINPPRRLERGSRIVFRTPHDVRFINDGIEGTFSSTALTVRALLEERGVDFDERDLIDPGLDTRITAGVVVSIIHTTTSQITEDIAIPFAVEERPDPALDQGRRQVAQPGIEGLDRTTFRIVLVGDMVFAKEVLSTARVREPQTEIISVGARAISATGRQTGHATWYATLYQPGTCAHLQLPFGTIVRVINTDTGASATCRVADRGPQAWTNNLIDLSPDVFRQLASASTGRIPVRLEYN